MPSDRPALIIESAKLHSLELRVRPKDQPTKRGRPGGVLGVMIFTCAGGKHPPADASKWQFHMQSTRTKMTLKFDGTLPSGTTVWLKACWINPRLQAGPFCDAMSEQLPGQLCAEKQASQDDEADALKIAA